MTALPLRHIVEPARLLLTWQPVDEHAVTRTRRTVGEVREALDAGRFGEFRARFKAERARGV